VFLSLRRVLQALGEAIDSGSEAEFACESLGRTVEELLDARFSFFPKKKTNWDQYVFKGLLELPQGYSVAADVLHHRRTRLATAENLSSIDDVVT
jgi:hypothetical protein